MVVSYMNLNKFQMNFYFPNEHECVRMQWIQMFLTKLIGHFNWRVFQSDIQCWFNPHFRLLNVKKFNILVEFTRNCSQWQL